jgi:hypothetical protein
LANRKEWLDSFASGFSKIRDNTEMVIRPNYTGLNSLILENIQFRITIAQMYTPAFGHPA